MESYTFGSHDFMMAVIEKQMASKDEYGGNNYSITLNTADFRVFVTILQNLALYSKVTHKDIEAIPGFESESLEPISEWAWDWLSGIAETLDVEGI